MKAIIPIFLLLSLMLSGTTLQEQAQVKINMLESLISQLEEKSIDTQHEQLALRTAEIFLKYADWDEANIAANTEYFESYTTYADNASQLANDLADFERSDIILLLDESLEYAQKLLNKEVFRASTPSVDWSLVEHQGDQLTYQGKSVFWPTILGNLL